MDLKYVTIEQICFFKFLIRQGCLVSRSGLDKEDCCLDIRKETGHKEEFLYKCILLYSIVFQVDWMYTRFVVM